MHDQLFQNQDKLQVADLRQYAAGLGLDTQAIGGCPDSGKHAADWNRTKALGEGYGVSGTPALFGAGCIVCNGAVE